VCAVRVLLRHVGAVERHRRLITLRHGVVERALLRLEDDVGVAEVELETACLVGVLSGHVASVHKEVGCRVATFQHSPQTPKFIVKSCTIATSQFSFESSTGIATP